MNQIDDVAVQLAIRKSTDEELKSAIRDEYAKDLIKFATQCITEDPHDSKFPFKALPVEKVPYISTLLESYQKDHKIVVVKSRQVLVTWIYLVAVLWHVLFHRGVRVALISKKAEDARKLVERIAFIYDKLPSWKPVVDFTYFPFPRVSVHENHSYVFGYPQGADQLRSETFTVIFSDEFAFQEDQDKTYRASKPTIDGGGRFIAVSTPNGQGNLFYHLCQDPTYRKHEIHYSMNPLKGPEWKAKAFEGMRDKDIQQEYEINFLATQENTIYGDFNFRIHVSPQIFNQKKFLLVGWDFGYNRPGVAFLQYYDGICRVLKSKLGYKITIEQFATEVLKLQQDWFPQAETILDYCDIGGKNQNSQTGKSDIQVLNRILQPYGRFLRYKKTKDLEADHNVIRKFLTSLSGGQPAFQIDPCNTVLVEGFRGGYHYHGQSETICGCGTNEFFEKEKDYYKHLQDAVRYPLVNQFGEYGAIRTIKDNALPTTPLSYDKRFQKRDLSKELVWF